MSCRSRSREPLASPLKAQPQATSLRLEHLKSVETTREATADIAAAADAFILQRELLPDGSERVTLPWCGESILIGSTSATGGVAMSAHATSPGVVPRQGLRRSAAAFLRSAADALERLGRPAPAGFRPQKGPPSTFDAMLQCVRARSSWQDSMDNDDEAARHG